MVSPVRIRVPPLKNYLLASAEAKKWDLVGVAGGLPDGGMILFWDTKRPSFGRTSRW
jgi:hypothetical protein